MMKEPYGSSTVRVCFAMIVFVFGSNVIVAALPPADVMRFIITFCTVYWWMLAQPSSGFVRVNLHHD
jgi:hypothetical protein